MFCHAELFTSNLSKWNTMKVENMCEMYYCSKMQDSDELKAIWYVD